MARLVKRPPPADRSDCGFAFGDDGIHLAKSIRVFGCVVSAEEKLAAGGKHGAYACSGTAPVAPVGSGQLWAGQCSGHDSSVLALRHSGRVPGAWSAASEWRGRSTLTDVWGLRVVPEGVS